MQTNPINPTSESTNPPAAAPACSVISRAGLKALIALQALTLVAVVASRPSVPQASAMQAERSGLPNAAEQRREQIELLKTIAAQLRESDARATKGDESTSRTLASIERQMGTIVESVERLRAQVEQSNAPRPGAQ